VGDQEVNGRKLIGRCFMHENEAEVKMGTIGGKAALHIECSLDEDCGDIHRW